MNNMLDGDDTIKLIRKMISFLENIDIRELEGESYEFKTKFIERFICIHIF